MSERYRRFHELKKKFQNAHDEVSIKKCSIDNCVDVPINAHTIHKKGALKFLAGIGENNSEGVYYLDDKVEYDFKNLKITSIQAVNRIDFKSIALASTFYGFCKKHDEVFNQEIENVTYDESNRMAFYHTFRAHSYALHKEAEMLEYLCQKILVELNLLPAAVDTVKPQLDKIQPLLNTLPDNYILSEEQVGMFRNKFEDLASSDFSTDENIKREMHKFLDGAFSKESITGKDLKDVLQKGMDFFNSDPRISELDSVVTTLSNAVPPAAFGVRLTRTRLSHLFENKIHNEFLYFNHSITGAFPLTGTFVAGYLDNIVAPFSDGYVVMPKYAVTFFPEPKLNRTIFIFGSFKENPNVQIFYSRMRIMDDKSFKKFMSNLILLRGSNTYFSPRFWNKLTVAEREIIVKRKELKRDTDFGLYDLDLNLFDQKYKD